MNKEIYLKNLSLLSFIFLKENKQVNHKLKFEDLFKHLIYLEPYFHFSHKDKMYLKTDLLPFLKLDNNETIIEDILNEFDLKQNPLDKKIDLLLNKYIVNNNKDYLQLLELAEVFFNHFNDNLGFGKTVQSEKTKLNISIKSIDGNMLNAAKNNVKKI